MVVCDGFVGNVVLKFYESAGRLFVGLLQERAPDVFERPAARASSSSLLDYSEYGGAPLLGVKGVSIICHGASSPNAIKNAIRVALQAVDVGPQRAHRGRVRAARARGTRMIPRPFAEVASVGVAVPPGVAHQRTISAGCSTRPTSGSSSAPASGSATSPGRSRPWPC